MVRLASAHAMNVSKIDMHQRSPPSHRRVTMVVVQEFRFAISLHSQTCPPCKTLSTKMGRGSDHSGQFSGASGVECRAVIPSKPPPSRDDVLSGTFEEKNSRGYRRKRLPPVTKNNQLPHCSGSMLLAMWLIVCASATLPCCRGFQLPAASSSRAAAAMNRRIGGGPSLLRVRHYPTTTQLHVSSIRAWLQFANKEPKLDSLSKQQQTTTPIFFKRQQQHPSHNKTQAPMNHGNSTNVTTSSLKNKSHRKKMSLGSNVSSSALPASVTWTPTSNNVSDPRRPSLQYGIFANTTSSLLHIPEYTTAWANTLSSTLHNTTSNAWSKVALAPLPLVGGGGIGDGSPPPSPLLLAIPEHLQPNDTLTVADLQNILQQSGYALSSTGSSSTATVPVSSSKQKKSGGSNKSPEDTVAPSHALAAPVSSTKPQKTKQGVAFPQPSVLDYQSLQKATAVASSVIGMLLATTLWPNLWLMGALVGAVYGHDLCSRPDEPPPSHLLARTLIGLGRRLARATLQFMDYCRTLWFLYKTGELSYQYYKRYEVMDQRFAIQSKLDAWNARFVQGKQQFDKWEQENEIGRTLLAGLRTVWLVDERSKRRAKQTSRYRVVQYLYDLQYWIGRYARKTMEAIRSSDWNSQLREFFRGVRTDLWSSGGRSWGARVGAVIASLFAVNVTGALFAISPTFLAILAIGVGIAWPSWVSELLGRVQTLGAETRARGRGEETTDTESLLSTSTTNTAKLLGRYDKSRYHYYKRMDGTKRYYRTGQALFRGRNKKPTAKAKSNKPVLTWPWTKPQKVKRPPAKEQWGLFGR